MDKIYWENGHLEELDQLQAHFEDCPSCGNHLVYSAEKKKIHCSYCGYLEDANPESDKVIENELKVALDKLKGFEPSYVDDYGYQCGNCGANFIIEKDVVSLNCGFCSSQSVNKTAIAKKFINPIGIIPFYISSQEASKAFKKWINQGWFHPSKLRSHSTMENLHGIYIPFWTFDAKTNSVWSGQAGHYYYVSERVRINGRMQTQQVRKVRWESRNGRLDHFFDDVTISGSNKINRELLSRVLPYRLNEVVNFDHRLLLGWETEVYDVELDEAYQLSDQVMDYKLRHMCSAQLGGDVQRNLHVVSTKTDQTFKLLVLPVWLSAYKYNNKIYHFVINGQTGRVYGKKPLSWVKIGFLILLFVLFIVGVYFLRKSEILMSTN